MAPQRQNKVPVVGTLTLAQMARTFVYFYTTCIMCNYRDAHNAYTHNFKFVISDNNTNSSVIE